MRAKTIRAALALGAALALPAAAPAPASAAGCPQGAVDLGSWCLDEALQPVPAADVERADWFYASARCAERGGTLPRAEQLVGAAARVRLASRLDDDPARALLDADASDGLDDWREMTATLITTRGGSAAGGALGTSEPATGDPRLGEPDPTPAPAETRPDSLQYLTVVDDGDRGGFAGARPVSEPERFRCAYGAGAAAAAPAPAPAPVARPTRAPSLDVPGRVSAARLAGGVTVRLACPSGCRYRLRLEVPAPRAWRAGLAERLDRPALLALSGRTAEGLDAGSRVRVRLTPPPSVRRALARIVRGGALPLRVRAELEAPAGAGRRRSLGRSVRLVR